MYAAIATRPDIAFAVNTLAQFNVRPSRVHWDAVVKIFRYLKGSAKLGILYDRCQGAATIETTGFADAGNGTNTAVGCPTTGGVYLMAGGAINGYLSDNAELLYQKWNPNLSHLVKLHKLEFG